MPFELRPLPFAAEALEPHISARTFSFHHGKHHQAYVANLNGLVSGTPLDGLSLEEIIKKTAQDEGKTGVFNNAAQVWNHDFFWDSLTPDRKDPSPELTRLLDNSFGGLNAFKEQFKQAGLAQFGSGWVWLVADADRKLKIVKTPNAANPLTTGLKPLLTCDVWEHAYYLDYQNKRADFIQVFLDYLIHWDFAAKNLG